MNFLKFLVAMFLSFLPGILGVIVAPMSTGGNLWYNTLNHSVLTPAGWVFPVVWTVLYFVIGVALFLVMRTDLTKKYYKKTKAYVFFLINLVLNTLWSFVFFGAGLPGVALLVLTALILVSLFMAREFFRINKVAFWLVVPYVLWLFFAFYLNLMIICLN